MKWLCKIGLHKWRDIPNTFGSLLFPVPIQQCKRCGLGWKQVTPEDGYTFDLSKAKLIKFP